MAARAANAADCVPEPVQVAGTLLRPFCLGHHLLFKRLGLPFAGSPAADCMPGQILIGVLICAQSYETTLDQLHTGEWVNVQAKWLKRVARRGTNIEEVEARFRLYLADGYTQPPVCKSAQGGISMSAPWECLLKVGLVRAGFTESQAINGYMPGRWYDYFTAMELTAAESCDDPKQWRPIFFNAREAEAIAAIRAQEASQHGRSQS